MKSQFQTMFDIARQELDREDGGNVSVLIDQWGWADVTGIHYDQPADLLVLTRRAGRGAIETTVPSRMLLGVNLSRST